MYPRWPESLPQVLNNGYNLNPEPHLFVEDMEVGEPEVRKASDQLIWSGDLEALMTHQQWDVLMYFYWETLAVTGKFYMKLNTGGTLQNHLCTFRNGAPPRRVKEGNWWRVTLPIRTNQYRSLLGNEL